MICLANSWRPGGRCVAGIDVDSGEWVRPIPPGGGAIPEARTIVSGRHLSPLDVIELRLETATFATRFQAENRTVRDWNWRLIDQLEPDDLLEYCSEPAQLLHSTGKVVEPSYLERLPATKWKSLELIHVEDLAFDPDPHKKNRWHAKFSSGPYGFEYSLTLTDPEASRRRA
jgi:hypothetical protein